MNYSGNGSGSNTADGWEALLLNSFYGTLTNAAAEANNNNGVDNNSGDPNGGGVSMNGGGGASSAHGGGGGAYDPNAAYNAYLQNNYTSAAPPPSTTNYYSGGGGGGGNGSVNNPLNYTVGGSNGGSSGGYSLTMPASPIHQPTTAVGGGHPTQQYEQQYAPPSNNAGEHHSHHGAPAQSQYLHYDTTAADPFADYNAYFNSTRGMQQQQQQQHFSEDFCDALLQGLDEPSLNSLQHGIGGTSAPSTTANGANFNGYQQQSQLQQQQQQPFTSMRGSGGGGMYSMGGQSSQPPNHHNTANLYNTNMYMTNQHQQQQRPVAPLRKQQPSRPHSSSSTSRTKRASATTSSTTTISSTTSSFRSPNEHDHSSQPVQQIDPLLETITLKVSSVSLDPLSGNQVVTHIRTKTDDVTTRFIPCVDFLVNCQQELRQGLQIAQRRRVTNHGRGTRTTQNMTPRQFHNTYVAPLPRRFERSNQSIMAREHLTTAKGQLQQLVKESAAAIPQGCDHVKNAFLGGMRENESWGLRKWLSKHGGAGSICNDLEEVMRTVKSLKKEETTTKRLAEMLRPIASQAHERLKKDVPQAYQEQSSAHPYLPFFHRLEACLKQMATYDPEDDDVICLDDTDDEEDVVAVVNTSKPMKSSSNSAVKETTPVKRRSGYDDIMEEGSSLKRSKACEDVKMPSSTTKKADVEVICLDDSSDEEEEDVANIPKETKEPPPAPPPPPPPQAAMPPTPEAAVAKPWRCSECTFLNSASSIKCEMCQDDGSSTGADELANFLGGSFLVGNGSSHSYASESSQSTSALQAADARELECLAHHISLGGNLPLQAMQHQRGQFWGGTDKFPRLLSLFRTIIQHPSSHRFIEPVNESRLFIMGMPAYTSVVKHPICFHAIVLALSRSEDAVTHPHLTTRLASGDLRIDGLQHWNMWNGLHLIEAIDLVFLNSLAYDRNNASKRSETESLRNVLWDGVNSILKSLQPHERRNHLPNRRTETSSFVIR